MRWLYVILQPVIGERWDENLQVSCGYSAVSPATDELQGYTATAVDEQGYTLLLQLIDAAAAGDGERWDDCNTAAGDGREMRWK